MNTMPDLKELEQSAFRSKFDDGLLDIIIGFLFLTFSQIPFLSDLGWSDFWSSMVIIPAYLIAWLFYRQMKKRIVIPRTGVFRYGRERKLKLIRLNVAVSAVLTISFILGIVAIINFSPGSGSWNIPIKLVLIILIGFSLAGWFLNLKRFFLYGFIFSFSFILGEFLFRLKLASHHGIPMTIGIGASLVIIIGILLLRRFININESVGAAL